MSPTIASVLEPEELTAPAPVFVPCVPVLLSLCPGKRLRLRNDEDGYDVHIVSDRLEELSPPATLVFFVVTVADFNKVAAQHTAPLSLCHCPTQQPAQPTAAAAAIIPPSAGATAERQYTKHRRSIDEPPSL